MSTHSKIPWTETTLNPWTGCTPVSSGCKYCYAKAHAHRFWGTRNFDQLVFYPERLAEPYRWRKPRLCLVCSMSDPFHPTAHIQGWTQQLLDMVTDPKLFCHTFQVLTKRPETAFRILRVPNASPLPSNVWLGATVESARWQCRIGTLSMIPAFVRFISFEPLLGPMTNIDFTGISWAIIGAESINGRPGRPCENHWIRSIMGQAREQNVAVFVKQLHHSTQCKLIKDPQQMAEILGTSVDKIQQWPVKA